MLKLLKINFILSILLFIFGIISISFFIKLSIQINLNWSEEYEKNNFVNALWLIFFEKFILYEYDIELRKWIMLFFVPFVITFFISLANFIINIFILKFYKDNPKNNFALVSGILGIFGGFLFLNLIFIPIAIKKENTINQKN